MKAVYATLIISVIFLSSCKQHSMKANHITTVLGTWELRERKGGNILPGTFAPGNGNLLTFSNADFKMYADGKLLLQGDYSIQKNMAGQDVVILDKHALLQQTAILEQDTLTLLPAHPDMASSIYTKVN